MPCGRVRVLPLVVSGLFAADKNARFLVHRRMLAEAWQDDVPVSCDQHPVVVDPNLPLAHSPRRAGDSRRKVQSSHRVRAVGAQNAAAKAARTAWLQRKSVHVARTSVSKADYHHLRPGMNCEAVPRNAQSKAGVDTTREAVRVRYDGDRTECERWHERFEDSSRRHKNVPVHNPFHSTVLNA